MAYAILGRSVNNLPSRPLVVEMNLVRRVKETECSSRRHLQAYGEYGTVRNEHVRM